jgi:hypothetical protein
MSFLSTLVFDESIRSTSIALTHADLVDKLAIVPGATFDSYDNQHKDEYLPGTRTEMLDKTREWA